MSIEYREVDGRQEPVPDGQWSLTLLRNPWPGSMAPDVDGSFNLILKMKDYQGFGWRHQGSIFFARHRDGDLQFYPLHNIIYMECIRNSEEYIAALEKFKKEQTGGWL